MPNSPGVLDRSTRLSPTVRSTKQAWWGVAVFAAAFAVGVPFADDMAAYSLFMATGLALGYILTRSRFGFAGGIKRIYVTGEGSLTRALLIMFALAATLTAGVHWAAAEGGAVIKSIAEEGQAVIPGSGSVIPIGVGLVLGGFLFGVGMIMAGGCASGTLADLGEGVLRAAWALPLFVLGSLPGLWLQSAINTSRLGELNRTVYLPDYVGYVGAVGATLAGLIGVYVIARKYEQYRKSEGYFEAQEWPEAVKPVPEQSADEKYRFFSFRTYHTFFVTRWTMTTGGVLLAIMFLFIIITTKNSWGITGPFAGWGLAFLNLFGLELTSPVFDETNAGIAAGLLNNGMGVRDIGMIFGSAIALLMAGRFAFDTKFRRFDVVIYMLGGLLMGIGARIAGGCNIGALFSGIGNLSLSGWVFGVMLFVGGMSALKLLANKVNIIGPDRHTRPRSFL